MAYLFMVSIPLTYSQFLDDNILLGCPIVREASKLNEILGYFSEASVMLIMDDKSKIFFFNTFLSI